MAEVFGVVAGAVGTADVVLELAKSVGKLKDFCDDVENAPADILDLVEEIDDMTSSLAALTATQSTSSAVMGSQPLERCLEHCKRANKRVSMVVTQLQQDLQAHRRRTALAFPLKKQKLREIIEKLERGKSSLALACQISMLSTAKTQAIAQQQFSQDLMSRIQSQGANHLQNFQDLLNGQAVLLRRQRIPATTSTQQNWRRQETRNTSIRIRLPAWLLSNVWEISTRQAIQGWTCSFRSYKIVLYNSPAFDACKRGDLARLQEMLAAKEVSLHDRSKDGWTLFNSAVFWHQMPTARFLFEMGADVQSYADGERPLLDMFWYATWASTLRDDVHDDGETRQNLNFLIEECGNDDDDSGLLFQEHLSIAKRPPATWTMRNRLQLVDSVMAIMRVSVGPGIHHIRTLLQPELIDPAMWHEDILHRHSLLDIIASAFVQGSLWDCNILTSAVMYIKKAVNASADLHRLSTDSFTPMKRLLWRVQPIWLARDPNLLTKMLRSWAHLLAASGVDLMEYGRDEEMLWRGYNSQLSLRIIGFTYGADVSDWAVFAEYPGDRLVGIFWDMIEHPERSIPGAWSEPDERHWEDLYFEDVQYFRSRRCNGEKRRARVIEEPDKISDEG